MDELPILKISEYKEYNLIYKPPSTTEESVKYKKILDDTFCVDLSQSQDTEKLIEEWGSSEQLRFGNAEMSVTIHTEDGEICEPILCKCGELATTFVMGSDSFLGKCHGCMYKMDLNL